MRKLVTYVVVVATIVWSLGLAAVVPASAAYTPVAGDLIKTKTDSAVYYIDASGKRNLFVNGVTFWTWYSGSWSALKMGSKSVTIKTLSQEDFDALTAGGHVAARPGVKLVKFQNSPKVYVVSTANVLREVSDAVAKSLFGNDYATKKVITIQNGFETDYTKGSAIASGDKLPDGSLIKYSGSEDIYYIQDGNKRMVSSDAFIANGFMASSVVTVPATMSYTAGTSITGEEATLTTVAGTASGPVATAGSVAVALASNTPAAGLALANAQRVSFTKVNFTAANDGDAIIDTLVVQRTGIGADTDFSEIILLDEMGNVLGNAQTLNSSHQVSFSNDITVPKGTTKSVTLAANMAGTVGGGNLPTLSLVSVVAKGSTTVTGSLPIVGNTMTVNSALTIGGVDVTDSGASYNPSNATKQVGTENYIFASLKATANSVEDVQVESIRWYQASTTADEDITGLELLLDGVTVIGTGTLKDKEVIFNFATPVKIEKGASKEFSLRGDIANGSGRVVSFGPNKKTDWKVKGLTYNAYLSPDYGADGADTEPNLITDQPETTIDKGSMTVSKATITSTNVAPGGSNQELSAFYVQVIGEPVVVTRLSVDVATSSDRLTNVKILNANGVVIAGPSDPSSTGSSATSTDTITFPVGMNKFTIKGDLKAGTTALPWVSNSSLAIKLKGAYITAKGQVTNLSITAAPASDLSLDTLTVKTAALAVKTSATPAAQSVVKGTSGYTFANFTLDTSGSGEDVKITQLTLKHTTTVPTNFDDLQNITLYDGATALNTPVQGSSETADTLESTATTTITLLTPLIVTKNTIKTLTLKADISGSASSVGHAFGIVRAGNVVATGNTTGTTVTPTVTPSDGQVQTVNAGGTLRYYAAGANPGNQLLAGNTLSNTVGVITVEALYENIEVSSLGMTFNSAAGSNLVSSLDISDGTSTWNVPVSGQYATVSPVAGSLIIPLGSSKTLTVKANTNRVGLNQAGTSGGSFTVTFSNVVAKGVSSGITGGDGGSMTITGQTTATNTNYVYATKPTVSNFTSSIGNGTDRTLFQFSVSADAKGDVGFYKVTFDITTSAGNANFGVTTSNLRFIESPGGSQTDISYRETGYTFTDPDGALETITSGDGGTYRYNILFNTSAYTASPNSEYRIIPAGQSKTYALIGNIAKSGTGTGSYSVSLVADNAATAVDDASGTDNNANDSFIWSDLNFGNNTGTATATNEWTNGYLLFATSTQSATL